MNERQFGSERRKRMQAFKESGVLGTPQYAATLRTGFIVLAIGIAISAYAIGSTSPSKNPGFFGLGIVVLGVCIFGFIFGITSLRAHQRAKRGIERRRDNED
jgi:hypothetical protein